MGNIPTYQNPFSIQQPFGFPQQPQGIPSQVQVQPQIIQQPTGLQGRYVSSPDDITPQEVSMGGNPSLFPLADGSAIIAKQWANDGTIKTVRYAAETPKAQDDAPGVTLADIVQQLDDIQEALDALKQPKPASKPARRTTKKEADDDAES